IGISEELENVTACCLCCGKSLISGIFHVANGLLFVALATKDITYQCKVGRRLVDIMYFCCELMGMNVVKKSRIVFQSIKAYDAKQSMTTDDQLLYAEQV